MTTLHWIGLLVFAVGFGFGLGFCVAVVREEMRRESKPSPPNPYVYALLCASGRAFYNPVERIRFGDRYYQNLTPSELVDHCLIRDGVMLFKKGKLLLPNQAEVDFNGAVLSIMRRKGLVPIYDDHEKQVV